MTPPGRDWNEINLSEDPALALLERLGYTYVPPETLEAERETLKEAVLAGRAVKALRRINPWLSEDGARKVVRGIMGIQSASLIEASEIAYEKLTYGVSVEHEGPEGKKGRTVQCFDFEHTEQNELIVTRQYAVRGAKKRIIPDVVVFVNGFPLAVVECKSPTLGEGWKQEAITQLGRYQELSEDYRELGAPRLFETVQVLVATCGQAACYGTVTTPHRFYSEWKTPWPMKPEWLAELVGREPTRQDVTLAGLLAPANLLDLTRSFVVFEQDAKTGRTIRKLARYPQFVAVQKAMERVRRGGKPEERGGVVWHTQGSGKSLTMLWLALKLRWDARLENPTIVIVTDRRALDTQIKNTFLACGFPDPVPARSVRDLRALLSGPPGKTVLTTVQKFQELVEAGPDGEEKRRRAEMPVLNAAANVVVLVDEAHRTQYGGLAANLRRALPAAAFFGFTGTPIDKHDRSTLTTFGSYVDTYTIEQAVADGATVPIYYESRLAELRIVGHTLDALFEQVFADRTDAERQAIKARYANEQALAGAPRRVEAICLDLVEHFRGAIAPGGFKAQVVACSREVAVAYHETLLRLQGPQSAVIISASNQDPERLVRHHTTEDQKKALILRFLTPEDPLQILVVCDMLLTGFDAPVEQVMYLDAPLREHALLQAIARVNRTAEHKTYGLVVDYWGVSQALTEALAIFAPGDVQGALTPKDDELPRLQARHAAVRRFLAGMKDPDDLQACVAVLEPEDVRARFDEAWKRFAQSLDLVLPDPRGVPYLAEARWLGKIRQVAAATYRDGTLDISDCGAKVRRLIEEAVAAEGIQILVAQVALFAPEFEEKLATLRTGEARASEMEHALRHEIHVRLDEDPVFYASLRERLETIIAERKAARLDAAQQLELLGLIRSEVRGHAQAAEQVGLSETGYAIYGLLHGAGAGRAAEPEAEPYGDMDEARRALAQLIEEQVESQVGLVDWARKDDVQKEMRRRIKRQLRVAGYREETLDPTAETLVDLYKARRRR